ncbi:MAG: uncharacterized protein QG567_826 [Campylobacterota bacterium]|nr:uncharacterized protein [Campylobacterota bacterium]
MVNWFLWEEEAFKKARLEKKPIFLFVYFADCDLCQKMQEEIFEKQEFIEILNNNFVSIKVDRDEQADIANYFKKAYKLLNRKLAKLPLSIFLTHEKKPFFAGSYIPPSRRDMIIGFDEVCEIISQKYQENPKELIEQAKLIEKTLKKLEINTKAAVIDKVFLKNELEKTENKNKKKFEPKRKNPLFLEDFAYFADFYLKEYIKTKEDVFLQKSIELCDKAIEKFYNSGVWFFAHGEFETIVQPYDDEYLSCLALLLDVLIILGEIVDKKYLSLAKKTLEYNSLAIMKSPKECAAIANIAVRL